MTTFKHYLNAVFNKKSLHQLSLALVTALTVAFSLNTVMAAPPVLAERPLGKAAGAIKPNMMFVFDTSLSMLNNKTNDALDTWGQCKVSTKDRNGTNITNLNIAGTSLTVTAPGHGRVVNDIVYLAIPGDTRFSGVYKINSTNATAATSSTCTAYNTSIIINNPFCQGATGGNAGNPLADPPIAPTPACSCTGSAPANIVNTSTSVNSPTGSSTNPAVCRWRDPRDNAAGTVCQASSGGTAAVAATTFTVTINALGASNGNLPPAALVDASVTLRQDDSSCYYNDSSNGILYYNEPPHVASKIQSLFYDPAVQYIPPPSPKQIGLGLTDPANRLPSMTRAYTAAWTKVSKDGTKLTTTGDPDITAGNIYSGFATGFEDMVYCDTPNKPVAFASDKLWHESARCKSNSVAVNNVLKSSNYPYPYPATKDGGTVAPSKTNFLDVNNLHQNGVAILTTENSIADLFAFGERYYFAKPFYYNVSPIEYCNSAKLSTCVMSNVATGAFTFPSYVRYCKTSAQATNTSVSPPATECQGLFDSGTYRYARYGLFSRVDVTPLDTLGNTKIFAKSAGVDGRTDCVGTTCTYDEEMTNFANWYAYYRNRIQLMKSAAGRTFDKLNQDYRVGLITVENYDTAGNYLPIKDFVTGTNYQKENWFKTLYSRTPGGGTSLRDVLGTVGRIYAGRKPIASFTATSDDPVQYSCQKNYTLLTTDGYWNGIAGKKADLAGGVIGNQDGAAPVTPPQLEGNTAADTLADVSQYYYQTDIRDTALNNCTGALGDNVCQNDVKANGEDANTAQHMATFTLGLGVDGILNSTDYKTALTGDYADLISGATKWPVPGADNGDTTITATERATVDDLWHAAVNGRGTYYSAKNPTQLINGITSTLSRLTDAVGSNAASAVSNNQPVAGDNFVFNVKYLTGTWSGNLFARTIAGDGTKSASALWCVETEKSVTPICSPSPTTGLASKISATADTRNIFANASGVLGQFKYASLGANQAFFNSPAINGLSQFSSYNAYQLTKLGGASLVDYIRGQTGFDNRPSNNITSPTVTDNRLYRQRDAVLGDIVDSDPVYVGTSKFAYTDAGYAAYKAGTATKAKMVYVGANDGMLHAFKADTGEEAWAFVPTAVMPNLWKLADVDYRNKHTNYVNGDISVADVQIGGAWKTILVGGLGQGGKGFYALDITTPATPVLLWEKDASNLDLGFSYGMPVVTKRASDSKWVVLITSGYNNATGLGKLFVLDTATGADLSAGGISTATGNALNPSGLSKVSAYASSPNKNNLSQYVYGGDLFGNIWRFDITANTAIKLTTLKDASGAAQAVTVAPSLGLIQNQRVVFIGTGKYIEPNDILPASFKQNTVYAIKDTGAEITSLRSTLVEQTLSASGANRIVSTTATVDWSAKNGWFVDLPNSAGTGELNNIDSQLISGALIVPTNIPPSGVCGEGTGYLNVFDYKSGGAVDPEVSTIVSTPIDGGSAGYNAIFDSTSTDGGFKIVIDKSNGGGDEIKVDPKTYGDFDEKRGVWRELIP